ncbi:hypothetical protein J2T55_000841 [Methylohalomonas lacus]|uniref:Uncharacterized protein n=1 Tax=Methylohalomonas lacus TaxID=398773 RepID=A0AAE3HLW3_9GAMM|nr:hypothetical protein [Methylohalomonas lacus]MCS3902837.1 hypothetical protein [Methylohalomonas lacus]
MGRLSENKIKKTFKQYLLTLASNTLQCASMVDDDVISQKPPQQQAIPGVDVLKSKWKQHASSSGIAWDRFSEDETAKSVGHGQKTTSSV